MEAGRWLSPGGGPDWDAVTPQRRTLASWFWHERYGERRNEITFTGAGLQEADIRSALDGTLLTDDEVERGRQEWAELPDPLFSDGLT